MRLVALLALVLACAAARAEDSAPEEASREAADAASAAASGMSLPPPPPETARAAVREPEEGRGSFGLLLDAGVPQGASVSLVYRPVPAVRFWAGPAWNYVGFGVQGGIAAVPWHLAVTPVLSAEAGRYFGADVSFLASDAQGVPEELAPLLEDMSYSYAAVHAGIEIGSQRAMVFSLRAGLAYVSLSTRGSVTYTDSGSGSTIQLTDPRVRGTIPSVKLGVQVWF